MFDVIAGGGAGGEERGFTSSVRRAGAFAIDWGVIVVWGTLLFAAVLVANRGLPPDPGGPSRSQAIAFVSMTLPVLLYFTIAESSRAGGTLGKRLVGLRVVDARSTREAAGGATGEIGGRVPFGRALVRNAIKFAPWELGHTVAQQSAYSGDSGMSLGWLVVAVVAMAGPFVWLVTILRSGRTPYDRMAGTVVVRR